MKLLSFNVYPVYDIPQQYRRRMAFSGGVGNLSALGNVIVAKGDQAVKSPDFIEALSGVVGFDSSPDGFEIPAVDVSAIGDTNRQLTYGGETGIYNFIAVLSTSELNSTRSIETRYVVSGYTSQAEASILGLLPDDMRLFINDIYGTQITYGRNFAGELAPVAGSYRLCENMVLQSTLKSATMGFGGELAIDVASMAKTAESVRKLALAGDEEVIPRLGGGTKDLFASNQQSVPRLMSVELTSPDNFVGVMAGAYLDTAVKGDDEIFGSVNQFFESAGNSVEGKLRQAQVVRNLANHDLFRAMSNALAGNINSTEGAKLGNSASFTLAGLRVCLVNPAQLELSIANSLAVARRRGLEIAGETTDNWVGRNNISTDGSITAFEIAMQVGQTLTRNGVAALHFAYDNRNSDLMAEPQLAIHPESIETISPEGIPAGVARRLELNLKEMFMKVSKFGKRRFVCRVIARVGTVVRIEIQMDGDLVFEKYTHASFMSNRLHSAVTNDASYVTKLAKGVVDVMSVVDEGYAEFSKTTNINNHHNSLTLSLGGSDLSGFNY